MNIMEILPIECVYQILLQIDFPEVCSVASVCQIWYQLMCENVLFFKQLALKKYPQTGQGAYIPEGKTWKWVLQCKLPFTVANFSGTGQKVFESGVYEGDWLDGKRTGKGTFSWNCGVYYQGHWVDDKFGGFGTAVWSSGKKYAGDWVDAKRSGKGKFYWPNGDTYEGEFLDNNRNGQGKFTWANGNTYEGGWDHDERHGKGKFVWKEGDIYDGDWKHGSRTGHGFFQWSNGDTYTGEWKDGIQNGKGCLRWCNGNTYDGLWEKGDSTDGVFYESISKLSFQRKQNKKDQIILYECMNPSVASLIKASTCTFSLTYKNSYFQYLFKHAPIDDRTRGICVSCYNVCLRKNDISLFKSKLYFGGNFYCDCGAGNLLHPCHAHGNANTLYPNSGKIAPNNENDISRVVMS